MRTERIPLLCITLVILVVVLSACVPFESMRQDAVAASISAAPAPTPAPTPEPTMPPPPETAEVTDAFCDILYSIPDSYDFMAAFAALGLSEPTFSDVLEQAEELHFLCQEWYFSLCGSCEDAVRQLEDRFPDIVLEYRCEIDPVDWKYAGALLWTLSPDTDSWDVFEADCSLEELETGNYLLLVHVAPANLQKLLYSIAGSDRDLYMNARYIQCYLTTVFDENGEETEYEMPELDPAYVATIQKPLDQTSFFDRWYQGRSRNTRKHTGLDMRAPANSNIYSCTDGTVLYIGYQAIPGYYVVVLDDFGYEYHYYHMIRETDFLEEGQRVKAGDLIGHVGNTGNSAVNHLHLGLVTPDGRFVKLYEIMNALYG